MENKIGQESMMRAIWEAVNGLETSTNSPENIDHHLSENQAEVNPSEERPTPGAAYA